MFWDMAMAYFKRCAIINYETYVQFYLCSLGAHIANYYNKGVPERVPSWCRLGDVMDIRLNLFSVGPPGSGKTLFIRMFLGSYGLIRDALQTVMMRKITDKGLIGGWDKEGNRVYGDAEIYKKGILGADEWDHTEKAAKQEHSMDLENSMLDLFDHGEVRYRMGAPEAVEFQSYVSLWAGTQSERFNVGSGMARRLNFLDMTPDAEMLQKLSDEYDVGTGIRPDSDLIKAARKEMKRLWSAYEVEDVYFTDSYKAFRNDHTDDALVKLYLDKFAIGYRVINWYRGGSLLVIDPDSNLHRIFKMAKIMRANCLIGATELAILKLLDKDWQRTRFILYCVEKLHENYSSIKEALDRLEENDLVCIDHRTVTGVKKKVQYVSRSRQIKFE